MLFCLEKRFGNPSSTHRTGALAKQALVAGFVELSLILKAMGVPSVVGTGAIRFSLGRVAGMAEIEWMVERLR